MKTITLFLVMLSVSFYTKGQERVWKKQTARIIDTRNSGLLKDTITGSSIFKMIVDAVKSGEVTIYNALNDDFTEKLTYDDLTELVLSDDKIDTMMVIDPVTGARIIKIRPSGISADSIYNYRVFEEWIFNPVTGEMNGLIKYVAPMRKIYGEDGFYRGRIPLFWISYKDLIDLLEKNSNQLQQKFNSCVWQSNFKKDTLSKKADDLGFNTKTKQWHRSSESIIDLMEAEDTVIHFFQDKNKDTILSEQIVNEIKSDKVPAWSADSTLFSKHLTKEHLIELTTEKLDTEEIIEVIAGNDTGFRIVQRDFNYAAIQKYKILNDWSYDQITGRTEIAIKGIAPIHDIYGDDGVLRGTVAMLWLRYADIQPILNRIEQYHPNNTFAMHIWNNFFLSDTKPVLVK